MGGTFDIIDGSENISIGSLRFKPFLIAYVLRIPKIA